MYIMLHLIHRLTSLTRWYCCTGMFQWCYHTLSVKRYAEWMSTSHTPAHRLHRQFVFLTFFYSSFFLRPVNLRGCWFVNLEKNEMLSHVPYTTHELPRFWTLPPPGTWTLANVQVPEYYAWGSTLTFSSKSFSKFQIRF